jgi:sugar lactone lactonase YvrE
MGDWGCLLWSDIPNNRVLRWTEESSGPQPSLRLVDLADLKGALPADTPDVSSEQRDRQLRMRRRGVQWRRRW